MLIKDINSCSLSFSLSLSISLSLSLSLLCHLGKVHCYTLAAFSRCIVKLYSTSQNFDWRGKRSSAKLFSMILVIALAFGKWFPFLFLLVELSFWKRTLTCYVNVDILLLFISVFWFSWLWLWLMWEMTSMNLNQSKMALLQQFSNSSPHISP